MVPQCNFVKADTTRIGIIYQISSTVATHLEAAAFNPNSDFSTRESQVN